MTASVVEPGTRRICTNTGLALVAGPVSSFRIARESYGPLAPPPRASGEDPRTFREGRALYALQYPEGWWIDATATETITRVHDLFSEPWSTAHGSSEEQLTLADLTGDDRVLTTSISQFIRDEVQLDDGTLPLGIQFLSKHGRPTDGSGRCLAYWMRQVDSSLNEPTQVLGTEAILDEDAAYNTAQRFCKIKSR